jgi:hypothetical protein
MPDEQPERRRMTYSPPPAGGLSGAAGAAARASEDRYRPEHDRKVVRRHARFFPVTCPHHADPTPVLYPFNACIVPASCPEGRLDACPFHVRKALGGMPGYRPIPCPCLEAVF